MRDSTFDKTVPREPEGYRPSFRYRHPPTVDGPEAYASQTPSIREAEVRGDTRVRFWIVDRDGSARRGEYMPGLGVREIRH